MFDVNQIRTQFPILSQTVDGNPLVYLDNAATTQKPKCVLEKLQNQYTCYNANVHRGIHYLSNKSTERMEAARRTVQTFLNAESKEEIIFTSGATEAINMLSYSLGEYLIQPGDEIIVSEMEHHANLVPWQILCERKKAILKIIPFDENGNLILEKLKELITERTRVLSVCHVSNVLGTVNPVRDIIEYVHGKGIVVVIDGAQAVAHEPVDVQELDCDFYCFSGHKIYGPMGVGVLYGKKKWLEVIPPSKFGGEMIDEVSLYRTTFAKPPYKFEAGTPNVAGIIALGEALEYVESLGRDDIARYEQKLLELAYVKLQETEGVKLIGNPGKRAGVISFVLEKIHHLDAAMFLNEMGIAVRSGHHCAQPVMEHYHLNGTVRISPAFYNTRDEIESFCENLQQVISFWKNRNMY